jgi:hypothetical protein
MVCIMRLAVKRIGEGHERPVPGDVVRGMNIHSGLEFIGRVSRLWDFGLCVVDLEAPLDFGGGVTDVYTTHAQLLTLVERCEMPIVKLFEGPWVIDQRRAAKPAIAFREAA